MNALGDSCGKTFRLLLFSMRHAGVQMHCDLVLQIHGHRCNWDVCIVFNYGVSGLQPFSIGHQSQHVQPNCQPPPKPHCEVIHLPKLLHSNEPGKPGKARKPSQTSWPLLLPEPRTRATFGSIRAWLRTESCNLDLPRPLRSFFGGLAPVCRR